jgi:hypothetical protein
MAFQSPFEIARETRLERSPFFAGFRVEQSSKGNLLLQNRVLPEVHIRTLRSGIISNEFGAFLERDPNPVKRFKPYQISRIFEY